MVNARQLEHLDIDQSDRDFVVKMSPRGPSIEHIDQQALAVAMAGGPEVNVKGSRQGMANDIKRVALQQQNDADRKRLLAIADKFEASIHPLAVAQPSEAMRKMLEKRQMRQAAHSAAERAETQHRLAGYPTAQGAANKAFATPEERARFRRLFSGAPPEPKEEPKKPPTTGEKIAEVAKARATRRQRVKDIKAAQPAPRRNVRLRVKKSAIPRLSKGKNVKLQVPSSKLPHTQQLRSVLRKR